MDKTRSLVTLMIRAEPGAVYPSHKHHGPEECFVISGSVVIDGRVLRPGDFHHADEDSDHGEVTTTEGAEVLIVGALDDYLPSAVAPADIRPVAGSVGTPRSVPALAGRFSDRQSTIWPRNSYVRRCCGAVLAP